MPMPAFGYRLNRYKKRSCLRNINEGQGHFRCMNRSPTCPGKIAI
jgi:hypothetical protein